MFPLSVLCVWADVMSAPGHVQEAVTGGDVPINVFRNMCQLEAQPGIYNFLQLHLNMTQHSPSFATQNFHKKVTAGCR